MCRLYNRQFSDDDDEYVVWQGALQTVLFACYYQQTPSNITQKAQCACISNLINNVVKKTLTPRDDVAKIIKRLGTVSRKMLQITFGSRRTGLTASISQEGSFVI